MVVVVMYIHGAGMDKRDLFPGRGNDRIIFSLRHHVRTGFVPHPSYPMGIGALTSGVKRPGRGAVHPLAHTSSWRGA